MSDRLERLQREIEAERQLALSELGLATDGPLIVFGDKSAQQVVRDRLARVPEMLRDEVAARMRVISLPWVRGRRVQGVQA
jgi:allophanate hydrolase subunit 1